MKLVEQNRIDYLKIKKNNIVFGNYLSVFCQPPMSHLFNLINCHFLHRHCENKRHLTLLLKYLIPA